jgi:RNA:NAD 2'-phosphotransferase (TPT1/KptA family)
MAAEVSDELRRIVQAKRKNDPHGDVPVIVTLSSEADVQTLREKGLKVRRSYENVAAVSGTIPVDELDALVEAGGVKRIEYDGEMHAY